MSDNEIELRYEITEGRKGDSDRFRRGQPQERHFDDFTFTFQGGILRAFTDKYDSEERARACLEPKLEDWTRAARIKHLRIGFLFSGADTVERPSGTIYTSVQVNVMPARLNVSVSPTIPEVQVPSSPTRESELAETIYSKLCDLEDEPVTMWTSSAYAIVNAIENTSGTLSEASKRYKVSANFLEELKKDSSGDHPTASRKPKGKGKVLTTKDLEWVREKALEVGYRVLEVEYCDNVDELDQITL